MLIITSDNLKIRSSRHYWVQRSTGSIVDLS